MVCFLGGDRHKEGVSAGVASVGFYVHWTQPIPSSSAADPPQARADSNRGVFGASVKRKGGENEGIWKETKREKAKRSLNRKKGRELEKEWRGNNRDDIKVRE